MDREDFFLFPGFDQILLCFNLTGENESSINFVHTDKLGKSIKEISLAEVDVLISDYTANYFNFDIKLRKRVIISKASLLSHWRKAKLNNVEGGIDGYRVINIG